VAGGDDEPDGQGCSVKKNLYTRIEVLERASAAARPGQQIGGQSPVEKLRANLHAQGIEQGPKESLAETTARALGISCAELKAQLQERAYAGPGSGLR
jgi:hypothetical protein